MIHSPTTRSLALVLLMAATVFFVACGSGGADDVATAQVSPVEAAPAEAATAEPAETTATAEPATPEADLATAEPAAARDDTASAETDSAVETQETVEEPTSAAEPSSFMIEVWADNWAAVYVDGALVGEDSVPITTERSFNAETFTFEAFYPFTIAIEAKDFKETDSGIEYIGQPNQQMGDGGIIAQITDMATGEIVAVTNANWSSLVVHQAPLNKECEKDADPDATCEFLILETPSAWADAGFDDSSWVAATEWSAAAVGPKDGYNEISWDASAQLIWGTDLETDNTVLLRFTVQ